MITTNQRNKRDGQYWNYFVVHNDPIIKDNDQAVRSTAKRNLRPNERIIRHLINFIRHLWAERPPLPVPAFSTYAERIVACRLSCHFHP